MKRYHPILKYNKAEEYTVAAMAETELGEWVRYEDVEKMESALKCISIWASFPEDAVLDLIRAKALEALGK